MLASFETILKKDEINSGWIYAGWAESKEVLGTGKAVKVKASIDGWQWDVTLMPLGDGSHMLPVKAAIRKKIKKELGDSVAVEIIETI